jgi:HAD superfamily hydrolase (TIGR01450 family)
MTIQPSFLEWYKTEHENLDAVVLDIDGVLIRKGKSLPQANLLIETLSRQGKPFAILTNSADESIDERRQSLSDAGIEVAPEFITSSGHSLRPFVEEHDLEGELFFMIARLGIPCYAEASGLRVTADTARLPECRGVLVGEGSVDWQHTINAVVNFFRQTPEAHLVCPNPDIYFPGDGGTIVIASGGITRFVVDVCKANGTVIEPVYLGKPHRTLYNLSHERLEKRVGRPLLRSRTIMVGDMLDGDIRGAGNFGYRTSLLLTGGTSREMLIDSKILPELVFEGL